MTLMKKNYKKSTEEKKPFAQEVAERIIAALENGTAPWQKPWAPGRPGATLPFNPTTQKHYRGINSLVLMMSGYTDTRWMTFKQAKELGGTVRKGEKGSTIQYWSFNKTSVVKDGDGKAIKDENGNSAKETMNFSRPRVFTASVFNAEQIDGLEPMELPGDAEWEDISRAESIIEASGADIRDVEGDRAFYSPVRDFINMPLRSQFNDAVSYYRVKLHELGHWTGHSSRLNRDLTGSFGSESYAKEELRAEISSMMIGDYLGLGHDPSQHIAYVQSWINVLKKDPLEIFRAAADAEKIKSLIFALEIGHEHDLSMQDDVLDNEAPSP
jgi:putative DNA primase/helicase